MRRFVVAVMRDEATATGCCTVAAGTGWRRDGRYLSPAVPVVCARAAAAEGRYLTPQLRRQAMSPSLAACSPGMLWTQQAGKLLAGPSHLDSTNTGTPAAVSTSSTSQASLTTQEAQLSQRDRAMLRVTEYFDVIQGHSRSFEITFWSTAIYLLLASSCNDPSTLCSEKNTHFCLLA